MESGDGIWGWVGLVHCFRLIVSYATYYIEFFRLGASQIVT